MILIALVSPIQMILVNVSHIFHGVISYKDAKMKLAAQYYIQQVQKIDKNANVNNYLSGIRIEGYVLLTVHLSLKIHQEFKIKYPQGHTNVHVIPQQFGTLIFVNALLIALKFNLQAEEQPSILANVESVINGNKINV